MKRRRISVRPLMSANAKQPDLNCHMGAMGVGVGEGGGEWSGGGPLVGGFLEALSISSDSSQDAPARRGTASLRLSLCLPVLPERHLK